MSDTETTITADAAAHVLCLAGLGGYPAGSFIAKLLEAWVLADSVNAAKLAQAFPAYGEALELLQETHGAEALRAIAEEG